MGLCELCTSCSHKPGLCVSVHGAVTDALLSVLLVSWIQGPDTTLPSTSQELEGVASGTGGRHTSGTLLNLPALL